MNAKSMALGASIAIVTAFVVALCVGRPKVIVEAPVTNPYSITNNVNNVSPITDTYPITNNVSRTVTNELQHLRPSQFEVDGMVLHEDEKIVKNAGDAKAAVLLMNHINWTVTKIMHYNDPALLEQEYNAISHNSILLDVIKDEEIIHIIKSLMDAITEMRIEETERRFLQEELDQGMSDAIYDAIPNPMMIMSSNPLSALVNLASAAASSAMNYKKAKANLKKKFKRANWELDKNRLWYLNTLNKDLLEKYWVLVDRYKIKDAYRVVEDDIVHLVERLKDDDASRKYNFLKETKDLYEELPVYWYYRGQAAYECNAKQDALAALNRYQKYQDEFGKILRHDKTAANVAMLKSIIILENNRGRKLNAETASDLEKQLKIITSNATKNDWSLFYYCALVYSTELKNDSEAKKLLNKVVDEFGFQRDNKLVDWKEFMSEKMESDSLDVTQKSVSSTDVLFECKTLLQAIETRELPPNEARARLETICKAQQTSARERLFCFCSMNYDGALRYIAHDVERIALCSERGESNDYIKVVMPLAWIIGREGDIAIHISDSDVSLKDLQLEAADIVREHEGNRQMEEVDGEKRVAMFFPCKEADTVVRKKIVLKIQFMRGQGIANKCYQIAVLFSPGEGDDISWVTPCEYALGEWVPEKDSDSHWVKDTSGNPKVTVRRIDSQSIDDEASEQLVNK